MVIMGALSVLINTDSHSPAGGSHKKQHSRKRVRTSLSHHAKPIYRDMFLFLYGITDFRFRALQKHYGQHGLTPPIHGNTKRLPKHALTVEQVKGVVSYIYNYAETHALVLPVRIPGYKQTDIKLLPCSTTKHKVWEEYTAGCAANNDRCIAYSTFTLLWRTLVPSIINEASIRSTYVGSVSSMGQLSLKQQTCRKETDLMPFTNMRNTCVSLEWRGCTTPLQVKQQSLLLNNTVQPIPMKAQHPKHVHEIYM